MRTIAPLGVVRRSVGITKPLSSRPEGSALGVRPEASALGVRPEGSALGVRPEASALGAHLDWRLSKGN
ncbi:MAG: hypothetical protein JAZ17_02220 [Candidatus Thiodiazotropha endolucinida]|nr:hypothetical protein [Candidatus Thiodiazotropha taylori]MCG8092436.1 hypothetical protein [Candidatus Thiodiazotropha endolucinida]MCW4342964.1 hypothetical protein [Candidatus Thiodiazotropha endolucinida]